MTEPSGAVSQAVPPKADAKISRTALSRFSGRGEMRSSLSSRELTISRMAVSRSSACRVMGGRSLPVRSRVNMSKSAAASTSTNEPTRRR